MSLDSQVSDSAQIPVGGADDYGEEPEYGDDAEFHDESEDGHDEL